MKRAIYLLLIIFTVQAAKAEGIFYYGCQYLYLALDEKYINTSGDNDYAYFKLQWIKTERLSEKDREKYAGNKICEDFFKKFDALYEKKEFYENLKKATEIREKSSNIYLEIAKLEEKKKKYDPKYDYKKLDSKLNFWNAKLRKLKMQIPDVTKYKEYQDIFEYLERTKPLIDKIHPEWGEEYRRDMQILEERYRNGYL